MSKAIEFGSLVGAQLAALLEAEIEAAQETSRFIEAIGFERDKEGNLALRMVSFDMIRRDVDGVERTHTIRIPALTLVPIPLLTIESAEIKFSARVEDVTTRKEAASNPAQRKQLYTLPSARLDSKVLVTRLARTADGTTKSNADLQVSVKLAQSPFPLGIERLLSTADLSVQDDVDA